MAKWPRLGMTLVFLLFIPTLALANQINGFTLVDAETNMDLASIDSGQVINLAFLPTRNLTIRANTYPATVSRVILYLTGTTTKYKVESEAPYALWGDFYGDYNAGAFNTGAHTLSATPYLSDVQGPTNTITFSVIDNENSGTPIADAGPDRFVTLPADSTVLNGSGSDDGAIISYQWIQLDGPNSAVLNGEGTATLTASGLISGSYTMRLTVTDDDYLTATDEANIFVTSDGGSNNVVVSGELKKWHTVTLTLNGPNSDETATPNPFADYRLNVTFTNGTTTHRVPGFFAADGNAAETGATSGNKWRVNFAPDKTGTWAYQVSFRTAAGIAIDTSPSAGSAVPPLDGLSGTIEIADTDKSGRDHRGKGRLQYMGGHYLKFAETGEYFLKQGADAPENFLAYEDFDNTPNNNGLRKSWAPHIPDWRIGDPTWKGGMGKGIIGAINYLAAEGMNTFSFISMNINGDDKNVFPYISDQAPHRTRMDCSKLDQWEIVFSHADKMGMFLHFKTQETENEKLLDNGDLGIERKLYYRELISRFGHHLALNWNLGEEINDATTAQKKAWAQYFYDTDPYHHHIVIHNGSNHHDLLGPGSKLTGFSLQTGRSDFSQVHSRVKDYLQRSAEAGIPWAVACDEPGDASHALRPDGDPGNSHEDGRKNGLWGTLMAGGWGNEWYFGYQHDHSDLTCQDFRSRDNWWNYCQQALSFFTEKKLPFWQMTNDNDLSSAADDYCFYQKGRIYIIYLKHGGTTDLDLRGVTGEFEVKWYDPRNGGSLQNASPTSISGGDWINVGNPPHDITADWVVMVRQAGISNRLPVAKAGPDQTVADGDGTGDESVTLDGSASLDPDGAISEYLWSQGGTQQATGSNPTLSLPIGTHTLTLTVKDDTGATDTDTVVITVATEGDITNRPPIIETKPWATPDPVVINQDITLQLTAKDPDNQSLTYTWSVITGPDSVSFTPNGSDQSNISQVTFAIAGEYLLRVFVSDGGLTVSEDLALTVGDGISGAGTDPNAEQDEEEDESCFIQTLW